RPSPGLHTFPTRRSSDLSCTGTAAACPSDAFKAATVECRAAAGDCDVAESCSGDSAACPTDAFKPATVECRAAAGDCDLAESCRSEEHTSELQSRSALVC